MFPKTAALEDLLKEKWLRQRDSHMLVWFTKAGKPIPVKMMSDEHLENAINMLRRNDEIRENIMDDPDI